MKRAFYLLLAAELLLPLGMYGQSVNWIKTADGQTGCKRMIISGQAIKAVLENGEKKSFELRDVLSYFTNDRLFVKMPLYSKGVKGEKVLMEFVRTRDDLSLYKYGEGTPRYFVFRGENLVIELLEGNSAEFQKYFGLNF